MKAFTLYLFATIFAAAHLGRAAESPPPPLAAPAALEKSPSPAPTAGPLINLDFAGGTIAQLITALAKSGGPPVNILGEKAELATELPPFSVRNADPHAVANSLNTLLVQRGVQLLPTGDNVFTLTRPDRPPSGGVTKSFQIAGCLPLQSVDDIVAAIKTAWELNPAHKPEALQLKYHPPTTLLLAFGPPEAIEIARGVVASLKGSPPREAIEPRAEAPHPIPPPSGPSTKGPPRPDKDDR